MLHIKICTYTSHSLVIILHLDSYTISLTSCSNSHKRPGVATTISGHLRNNLDCFWGAIPPTTAITLKSCKTLIIREQNQLWNYGWFVVQPFCVVIQYYKNQQPPLSVAQITWINYGVFYMWHQDLEYIMAYFNAGKLSTVKCQYYKLSNWLYS